MRIIVCIKVVPKLDFNFRQGSELKREEAELEINPSDRVALSTALKVKEKNSTTEIMVISMGVINSYYELQQLYSFGVNKIYLLNDRAFAGADTLATSYTLFQGINKVAKKWDIILCGKQSSDGGTEQIGARLAEWFNTVYIAGVHKVELASDNHIRCTRTTDYAEEIIKTKSPLVISNGNHGPALRFPSIKELLTSSEKEIYLLNAEDLQIDREKYGLSGSATKMVGIQNINIKRETKYFTSSREDIKELMEEILSPACIKGGKDIGP